LHRSIPAFELTVAIRHITYRRWRTFLSVGAVALAVAISIIFVSFQNGFQDFLFNIIFRYLPHITVSPVEGKDYLHLYRGIIDIASSIPGVFAVSPTLATTVTLVHKNKAENVAMIGIDPLEGDKISDVSKSMIEGNLSSVLGGKRIVMGRPLADKLKLKRGDTVLASFPDATATSLVISGIFEYGYKPVDESITYISLETARGFLGKGDVLTSIEIKLMDPFQAEEVADELRSHGYNAKGWQQLFPDVLQNLAFERTRNEITLLLLMIIAAFGIASIMNMLVREKTQEIGMLLAMGAAPQNIKRLFLLESGLLGLLGALVGCVLGLLVSLQMRRIQITGSVGETYNLPILINPQDFLVITLIAVLLSIAAGTYQAYRASKLDPVIALRG
jgi:lipoprotein-releasing system permease protein